MLARATLTIDLGKIEENARRVVAALPGIQIVGVTKVTCGAPEVARAMLAGGVGALAESRLENAARLRDAGICDHIWLLRAPTPSLAEDTVRLIDISAISELAIAEALDAAAARVGRVHSILAMVDIGDRREGMMPSELPAFLSAVEAMGNVDVFGIGASLTCYGAIVPDEENLGLLASLAQAAQTQLGRPLVVSGGSSTSIDPMMHGRGPAAIDNLRIGEAIVLGVDPATRLPIPGLDLHTDALTLSVPVVECMRKPSMPAGTSTQDAFGTTPSFVDRGERLRAIGALGRQDAPAEGLTSLDPGVEILGASSDHLVLDVEALAKPPAIGESLAFRPGYAATLGLFTSSYVDKRFV
ncbi:MAG: alanine racemase [Coriobacteriia bacterium]|nr:alanine racemase [Coriobacteriia bacterium]